MWIKDILPYVDFSSSDNYYSNRVCFLFERVINYAPNRPVSSVVKCTRSRCKRYGVRLPGRSNRAQCRQRSATAVTFLRRCLAQAPSRGVARHSLRASTYRRKYNEDLIFCLNCTATLFLQDMVRLCHFYSNSVLLNNQLTEYRHNRWGKIMRVCGMNL